MSNTVRPIAATGPNVFATVAPAQQQFGDALAAATNRAHQDPQPPSATTTPPQEPLPLPLPILPPPTPLLLPTAGFPAIAQPPNNMEQHVRADADGRMARADPETRAAYDRLVNDPRFTRLSSDTRTALLSQAMNYPNASSINNLSRLLGTAWFPGQSLADQQRSAKMVAFVPTYQNGDVRILNNTLNQLLDNPSVWLKWVDHPVWNGTAESAIINWLFPDEITLNANKVPAGNDPMSLTDGTSVDIAVSTLPHEINHLANNDHASDSPHMFFGNEYRAYYVGYMAKNGHPPTVLEAYYNFAQKYLAYEKIKPAFDDEGSAESNRIVNFIARLIGLDPNTASRASVMDSDQLFTYLLQTGGATAPPPTKLSNDDDELILDNSHFG